ncbi:heme ABC transporter, heme-binding protein isdE [Syntrophobotulus glycolicus DSM 8271]|uniref:High-affinity heme uptake system protein IsdE n=1 Tax=Syntrophobotulus glycolicus (strain DSM 8271 / FlGlyR) TaxID=645991 RepID=F0SX04_SYNGF|nr:heme ABC transporter substrate-binding protein IsdE [Syntrophobotulus glycolicus]ADY55787.1 heme ABC transporter, heme-binding protein isdE [Syntrophobotulus glycolicus DSM 8271]
MKTKMDMKIKTKINLKRDQIITVILSLILAASLTAGCAVSGASKAKAEGGARIVSTSVSVCEITDRLDLDLVGIPTSAYTLPERYREVTKVGMPMTPDLEILSSLKPTDVISPNSLQYDLKPKYESIGVACTFINLMSLEGMLKSIEQLGGKYDRVAEASQVKQEYETFMAGYNSRIAGKTKPRVLLLMGLPGAYMVATEKSYVGDLVKLAGGENVFAGDQAFLNLNTEAIAQTNPDIILRAAHGLPEEVKESFAKEFRTNDIWQHFRAVQNGKVYDLDYNLFGMSASLDYQEALQALQTMLYGN